MFAAAQHCKLSGVNPRNLFLRVLEAGTSQIKALAYAVALFPTEDIFTLDPHGMDGRTLISLAASKDTILPVMVQSFQPNHIPSLHVLNPHGGG